MNPAAGNFGLKNGKEIVNRGEPVAHIWDDFCGNTRDKRPDIGALEYDNNDLCYPLGDLQ